MTTDARAAGATQKFAVDEFVCTVTVSPAAPGERVVVIFEFEPEIPSCTPTLEGLDAVGRGLAAALLASGLGDVDLAALQAVFADRSRVVDGDALAARCGASFEDKN